ncbi:hypothetical protein L6452_42682 [Arctium lappa]|uniref:Uncharacterized protein n=2 Tax=Arctium lappa TaxID=4217 RepID=A0ACB8XIW1_ARCLA|nr:hypothetical protein L6452_42680 [Arctium lappa]KAI3667616.1 hypothetical protein L6452_42682 [Arctium lappa]
MTLQVRFKPKYALVSSLQVLHHQFLWVHKGMISSVSLFNFTVSSKVSPSSISLFLQRFGFLCLLTKGLLRGSCRSKRREQRKKQGAIGSF